MGDVIRGPDYWFERHDPPRIKPGSIVSFGIDPETGNAFPDFDVLMVVLELYTDRRSSVRFAKVAISPNDYPDAVEYHDIPIDYLELIE
tara:strand:- start:691 stop:957 length:267 start_codon:yes stop_codon:yes gene_type:complete